MPLFQEINKKHKNHNITHNKHTSLSKPIIKQRKRQQTTIIAKYIRRKRNRTRRMRGRRLNLKP